MTNQKTESTVKQRILTTLGRLAREAVRVDEPRKDPYPETVAECIDDELKYKPAVETAIKKFRANNPWGGTLAEQQVKYRMLNTELAVAQGIQEPRLVFVDKFPAGPCCFPGSKPAVIMMEPVGGVKGTSYSVVAFLHEFAHTLGKGERGACRWSLNLFKRFWPKTFDSLDQEGHMLYRRKPTKKKKPVKES